MITQHPLFWSFWVKPTEPSARTVAGLAHKRWPGWAPGRVPGHCTAARRRPPSFSPGHTFFSIASVKNKRKGGPSKRHFYCSSPRGPVWLQLPWGSWCCPKLFLLGQSDLLPHTWDKSDLKIAMRALVFAQRTGPPCECPWKEQDNPLPFWCLRFFLLH